MLMQVTAPGEFSPLEDFFRQLGKNVLSFPGQLLRGFGEAAQAAPPLPFTLPAKLISQPAIDLGGAITEGVESLIPEGPEGFAGELGAGFGSAVGFIGSAALGPAGPLFAGGVITSDELAQEAEAFGADEGTVLQARALGGLIGLSEGLPVNRLLNRLDKFSGGGLKRVLIESLKGGGENVAQEVFQQITSNMTALGLFDKNRELTEGVLNAGGVGLIVGMVLSGAGTAAVGNITSEEVRELMLGPEGVTKAGFDLSSAPSTEPSNIDVLEGFVGEEGEKEVLASLADKFSKAGTREEAEPIAEQIQGNEVFQRVQARYEELVSIPNPSQAEIDEMNDIVGVMRGRPVQQLDAQFSVATPPRPQTREVRETILEATYDPDTVDLAGIGLDNAHRRVLEDRLGITSRRMGKDVRSVKQAIQQAQIVVAQDSAKRTAAQIAVARAIDITKNLTGIVTSNRSMLMSDVEHGLMLLGGGSTSYAKRCFIITTRRRTAS